MSHALDRQERPRSPATTDGSPTPKHRGFPRAMPSGHATCYEPADVHEHENLRRTT